jgi:hypothetical protein
VLRGLTFVFQLIDFLRFVSTLFQLKKLHIVQLTKVRRWRLGKDFKGETAKRVSRAASGCKYRVLPLY